MNSSVLQHNPPLPSASLVPVLEVLPKYESKLIESDNWWAKNSSLDWDNQKFGKVTTKCF